MSKHINYFIYGNKSLLKTIMDNFTFNNNIFMDTNIIDIIIDYMESTINIQQSKKEDEYTICWQGDYCHGKWLYDDRVHIWLTNMGGYSFGYSYKWYELNIIQTKESQKQMYNKFAGDIGDYSYDENYTLFLYGDIKSLIKHIASNKTKANDLSDIEKLYSEHPKEKIIDENSFYCVCDPLIHDYHENPNCFFIKDFGSLCKELLLIHSICPLMIDNMVSIVI
jgi:hypothetical protein